MMQFFNIEAEEAVISALLTDNEIASVIFQNLKASDFSKYNEQLFQSAFELYMENIPIDLISLANKNKGCEDKLLSITTKYNNGFNIKHYVQIIKELSLKRQIKSLAESALRKIEETDSKDLISDIDSKIMDIAGTFTTSNIISIKEAIHNTNNTINDVMAGKQELTIKTGFNLFDEKLGGLTLQELTVLAARPSVGKTSLAMSLAMSMANIYPVAFFSLEMSTQSLMLRLITSYSGINSTKIKMGKLSNDDLVAINKANKILFNKKLFIDDTPAITITMLKSKIKSLIKKDVKVVIVDYLQLMTPPKAETRNLEIGKITAFLKGLAKELNIHIIALSQLSRVSELTKDRRPELHHLRDSGSIEQDADNVWFIYRPEMNGEETCEDGTPAEGRAEIIVRKNRNGKIGMNTICFDKERTLFYEEGSAEKFKGVIFDGSERRQSEAQFAF